MLINCKVCGDKVAPNALTCPHCGAKLKSSFGEKILKTILYSAFGFIGLIIVISLIMTVGFFIMGGGK